MIHKYLAVCNGLALYLDNILIGIYMLVVPHSDRGENHAHINGKLLSEDDNSLDEGSACGFVRKGDKGIAELHFDRFNIKELINVVNVLVVFHFGNSVLIFRHFLGSLLLRLLLLGLHRAGKSYSESNECAAQYEKGNGGEARDKAHYEHYKSCNEGYSGL